MRALALLSPVYPGAERGLLEATAIAMKRMDEFARRAQREGIGALLPLFDALPTAIRERAKQTVLSFDPDSVAATTAFLASGAQPFTTIGDLTALSMPVLVVPGADPEHPSEVAELYAASIPHCRLERGDPSEVLARFCLTAR